MQRIQSRFPGKCCQCGKAYPQWETIGYDANGPKGKKAYCLDCAGSQIDREISEPKPEPTVSVDAATELAKAKAQLAALEAKEKPAPAPKPVVSTDPLAAAIAAAVEPLIKSQLDEARVIELVQQHAKPGVHTITVKTPKRPEGIDMGRQHKQFEDVLITLNARMQNGDRLNAWITGTAGTGKTTAMINAAKAMGMPYAVLPTQTDAYGFYGVKSPFTGKYFGTPPREIWQHGGMLILDDFDGTPADVAIQLNAPFANGSTTFPDGKVDRHADCCIGVTANTWGTGATTDYVGTTKQNAAFLDRFVFLDWEIDEQLELDTCPSQAWAKRVQQVRANVRRLGMKFLVTPRASYYGAALLEAGMPQAKVEKMVLRKGMTDDQWRSVSC